MFRLSSDIWWLGIHHETYLLMSWRIMQMRSISKWVVSISSSELKCSLNFWATVRWPLSRIGTYGTRAIEPFIIRSQNSQRRPPWPCSKAAAFEMNRCVFVSSSSTCHYSEKNEPRGSFSASKTGKLPFGLIFIEGHQQIAFLPRKLFSKVKTCPVSGPRDV